MSSALQLLNKVVRAESTDASEEYRWESLLAAMRAVISAPLSAEAEGLLLSVLRLTKPIRLGASSGLPHSMPPEDMLKSLALQALAKWTGLAHLPEKQRVQVTAASPALAGIARAVIRKATQVQAGTESSG